MRIKKTEKIVLFTFGLILIGFLIIPFDLPFNLSVQGKLIPIQEWYLVQDGTGSVSSVQKNHLLNTLSEIRTYVADRGDVVELKFNPAFLEDSFIQKNDLIATIKSSELDRQQAELKRQITIAKSDLTFFQSGSKAALIVEAQQRLILAKARLEQAIKESTRKEALYKNQLISIEDFESVQSDLNIKKIDVSIQEAALQNLNSGAKPEQIQRIEQEISGYELEINVLEERQKQFELHIPFSGQVIKTNSADTVAFIADTTKMILVPVPIRHYSRVKLDQKVHISVGESLISGSIIKKSATKAQLNGESVVLVFAEIEGGVSALPIYSIGEGHIECDPMTPMEYVFYHLKHILGS